MEEAALDPLIHVKGTLDPVEQVWRMTMVVETVGDLRKSVAKMLDPLLIDKRPAPLPNMLGAEGSIPFRRVCDEAYVQLSRLAVADPFTETFMRRMHRFLEMPPAGRDAEIERARQSADWRSLLR